MKEFNNLEEYTEFLEWQRGAGIRCPVLYVQNIEINPEMYPEKPPDRSQLYRYLNPPEENPWLGGVPIGKIVTQEQNQQHKLIIRQFKHKLSSEIYNPPFHKTFK